MKQVQFRGKGVVHNVIAEAGDYYILDGHPTNWNEVYQAAVLKSAVTVVEEVTYKVGQMFKIGDDLAILAQTSRLLCALIMLKDGNRYSEPIKVDNSIQITQEELNRMSHTRAVLVT